MFGVMEQATEIPELLETAVGELLQAAGQLIRRLRTEANPAELTWSQSAALARLAAAGWMTIAELARTEGVKPQSMGVTLAGLERDGLIERRADPADGRQFLFGLTDAGAAVRRENRLLKRQWLAHAMARLSPGEQKAIISAATLIKRLSA